MLIIKEDVPEDRGIRPKQDDHLLCSSSFFIMCWLWSAASTSLATCVLAFCKFSVRQECSTISPRCEVREFLDTMWNFSVVLSAPWRGPHTSQVSVELLQPPDLSHQPPPQRLLQVLPLTAALHQRLVGLGNPLDLLLQLGGGGVERRRRRRGEVCWGKQRREKVERRNLWLTYFTCQGGAGMLIHVVAVHTYLYVSVLYK